MPSPDAPQTYEARSPQRQTLPKWTILMLACLLSWLIYRSYKEDQLASGSWGCEMSWMTPSYIALPWKEEKYRTFLYREQGWDLEQKPSGHPVIFIPGNAGSYQQVRSIASSASRQYFASPGQRKNGMEDSLPLDFFTVDFNEDFSAFHAATMEDQARYLNRTIQQVLNQYKGSTRPPKVSLVGHSMGGIVARLAVAFGASELVDAIITMSTPHSLPPLTFDRRMETLYRTMNNLKTTNDLPLLVSICGGVSDTQIVSDSCGLSRQVIDATDGFSVFTSAIPQTWTGVDHQAIVWCHQIRSKIAGVLLEMTTKRSRGKKLQSLQKWLLGMDTDPNDLSLSSRVSSELYPVVGPRMVFLAESIEKRPSTRFCKTSENCIFVKTSVQSIPLPRDRSAPFPLVGEGILPSEELLVITVEPPSLDGTIQVGHNNIVAAGVSQTYDSSDNTWRRVDDGIVHARVHFRRPHTSSLLVNRLQVKVSSSCTGLAPIVKISAISSPDQELTHESSFYVSFARDLPIHSHTASSPFGTTGNSRGLIVETFQDPACPVEQLSVSLDWRSSLSKVVIRYRTAIVAWIIAWVAIVIRHQLDTFEEHGDVKSFDSTLSLVARRSFARWSALLTIGGLLQAWASSLTSTTSLLLGSTDLILVSLIPVLAVISFAIVVIITTTASSFLWLSRRSISAVSTRHVGFPKPSSPRARICIGLMAAGVVLTTIPHQLAFIISLLIHCLSTIVSHLDEPASSRSSIYSAIAMLLLLLAPANAVVIAVWGRNLWTDWRYPFPADHNLLNVAPVLLIVELCSSGAEPRIRKRFLSSSRYCLWTLASCAFFLGPRYTFVIPYLANVCLLCLCGLLVQS